MLKLLTIILLCSSSLTFGASLDNCNSSYIGSKKRVKNFIQILKVSIKNPVKFSDLFKLPIKLEFDSGNTKTIRSKKYLIENFSKLMKSGLKDFFSGLSLDDAFCNYQGVAFANGLLWADAQIEKGTIQIKSLNFSLVDFKTDFDVKHKGIGTISYDERVIFNKLAKKNGYKLPVLGEYNLYNADITNDGKVDYVLTYINSGSGKYSGIETIIEVVNGEFKFKELETYKISELPISHKRSKAWKKHLSGLKNIEFQKFHGRLGKPFLYIKNGKTIANFSNDGKINIPYMFKGQLVQALKE
jgi:hypothetical protein